MICIEISPSIVASSVLCAEGCSGLLTLLTYMTAMSVSRRIVVAWLANVRELCVENIWSPQVMISIEFLNDAIHLALWLVGIGAIMMLLVLLLAFRKD